MTLTTWHSNGGASLNPLATWDLEGADALFGRSFVLPFSTGPDSRCVVVLDGTELGGSFGEWEYDARDAASPESIGVADKGAALFCTLPAPRRIIRISLSHAQASVAGHSVKLYRLDGDTIADSATISVANDATIAGEFIAARFALTLEDGSGSRINLSASNLASCRVCSVPATPRIILLPPQGTEGPSVQLWQKAGQPEGAELDFTLTKALTDAFNSTFGAIPATGSQQLRILFATDAPSRVTVSGLSVAHESEFLNLPWERKQRFVFDGRGEQTHEVALGLDSGVQVTAAWCESSETFGIPTTDVGAAPDTAETPRPASTGIRINENAQVEQPISLVEAIRLQALWAGVMGLATGSALVVTLLEAATGRTVCSTEKTLEGAGWRGGVRVTIDPVLVPSGDYVVRIGCNAGALMWFTTPGEPSARIASGQTYDGLQGIHVLERAVLTSELTPADQGAMVTRQPYELDIGGIPVAEGTIGDNGRRSHDLTDAISQALTDGKQIVLGAKSRQRGEVTLYPLTIRYTSS